MKFFVPEADDPEMTEKVYAEFAEACHSVPLPLSDRIYSITWQKSTIETWTATVGKPLSGKKKTSRGKGSTYREWFEHLSDPATVLAIFPGQPYMVFTTGGLSTRSYWVNPLMASATPSSVELFTEEPETEEAPAAESAS